MNPNECRLFRIDGSFHQCQVMMIINLCTIEEHPEFTKIRRHIDLLLPEDEFFALPTMGDQILDRADLETMLFPEFQKIGKSGHGSVCIQDFTDHARWIESRKFGQINPCFRVARSFEDATLRRLQGKEMTRLTEIAWARLWVGQHFDGGGAIAGADAGCDAVGGIHGDGEISGMEFAIMGHHALEPEMSGPLFGDWNADQATTVGGHEINSLRSHFGGGHHKVPFVFTILVIGHDHHPPLPDLINDLGNRIELRGLGSSVYRGLSGAFLRLGGKFFHAAAGAWVVEMDFFVVRGLTVRLAIHPPPMT